MIADATQAPATLAALLEGAADGLRRRAGLRAWPMLRPTETELTAKLRQVLGADRLDQVFSAGSRLNQQQAVAQPRTGAAPAPRRPNGPAQDASAVVCQRQPNPDPATPT